MKKTIIIISLLILFLPKADACVGKVLHIGVIDSPEGQVLAEVLSSLINERTGSTVAIQYYHDERELYEAIQVNKVDISVENTSRAMHVLNRPSERDMNKAYEVVKAGYEKEKGVVWLKPFGFVKREGASQSYTAAILRVEVINNFPALPRVIGKLGGALNDDAYGKLMKTVGSGETPKKAARDFLKSKKLI
jgi:glycine betaine/choline ABC-type transport system substrate-binding protein